MIQEVYYVNNNKYSEIALIISQAIAYGLILFKCMTHQHMQEDFRTYDKKIISITGTLCPEDDLRTHDTLTVLTASTARIGQVRLAQSRSCKSRTTPL